MYCSCLLQDLLQEGENGITVERILHRSPGLCLVKGCMQTAWVKQFERMGVLVLCFCFLFCFFNLESCSLTKVRGSHKGQRMSKILCLLCYPDKYAATSWKLVAILFSAQLYCCVDQNLCYIIVKVEGGALTRVHSSPLERIRNDSSYDCQKHAS